MNEILSRAESPLDRIYDSSASPNEYYSNIIDTNSALSPQLGYITGDIGLAKLDNREGISAAINSLSSLVAVSIEYHRREESLWSQHFHDMIVRAAVSGYEMVARGDEINLRKLPISIWQSVEVIGNSYRPDNPIGQDSRETLRLTTLRYKIDGISAGSYLPNSLRTVAESLSELSTEYPELVIVILANGGILPGLDLINRLKGCSVTPLFIGYSRTKRGDRQLVCPYDTFSVERLMQKNPLVALFDEDCSTGVTLRSATTQLATYGARYVLPISLSVSNAANEWYTNTRERVLNYLAK